MRATPMHAALAAMSPQGRQQLKKMISGTERFSVWNKYYSTLRFAATVAGAGPFTYTFPVNELRAFGYVIGQDMAAAGFTAGTIATNADTNLIKPGETVSGETVLIYGLSVQLTSDSDAQLAKIVWPTLSIIISMNGDQQTYKLGTAGMVPGGGGLTGFGDSYVVVPDFASTIASRSGAMSNGDANVSNFYPFPQPILWKPSGEPDSTLIVKVKNERQQVYTTLGGIGDRVAAAGINAWTHPAANALGSFFGLQVHFHSRQISRRSANS